MIDRLVLAKNGQWTLQKYSLEKRCWEGYEPTPGKKPYEEGSCQPVKKDDAPIEKKPFNIKETPSGVFTHAHISGAQKEHVEQGMKHYFGNYAPAGYSTQVTKDPHQEGGQWHIHVKRYSSAD